VDNHNHSHDQRYDVRYASRALEDHRVGERYASAVTCWLDACRAGEFIWRADERTGRERGFGAYRVERAEAHFGDVEMLCRKWYELS